MRSIVEVVQNLIKPYIDSVKQALTTYATLIVSKNSVNALPTSITNSAITTDMKCIKAELSNPDAQTGDWTVNTDTAGTAQISGTINGTTNITLYLMKSV